MYFVHSYNTIDSFRGTVVEQRKVTPFYRLLDAKFFLNEELEKFGNAEKVVWKKRDLPTSVKKRVTVFDGFDRFTFFIVKLEWGETLNV